MIGHTPMSLFARTGLFLILLSATVHVHAHAIPLGTESAAPSADVLTPLIIDLHFNERVDPAASSIRVFAPDGTAADTGISTVDPADPRHLFTHISGTATGTYTVLWQVVSRDDGHFTKGSYLFSVGKDAQMTPGQETLPEVEHRSSWALAIMIWLELLGGAMMIGVLALLATVWERPQRINHLRAMVTAAALLIATGCIGYLCMGSLDLAVDRDVPFGNALWTFFQTVVGRFTLYRMVLGIAACALFLPFLPSILQSKKVTKTEWALWAVMIAMVILRARVSHAAASLFLPTFSIGMNAVHLLFKDVWIGGLVVFFLATPKTLSSLRRFSRLLMVSLAIGGASGMYIVWLHLKDPLNLFTTHWGGHAIALGSFALLLLTLRLYQHHVTYRSLLKVENETATATHQEEAAMFPAVLLSEMLTGLAVLLFSSMLIITTPPLPRVTPISVGAFEGVLLLTALTLIILAVVESRRQKKTGAAATLPVPLPPASRQSLLFVALIDICILAMVGFLLGSHMHAAPSYLTFIDQLVASEKTPPTAS